MLAATEQSSAVSFVINLLSCVLDQSSNELDIILQGFKLVTEFAFDSIFLLMMEMSIAIINNPGACNNCILFIYSCNARSKHCQAES